MSASRESKASPHETSGIVLATTDEEVQTGEEYVLVLDQTHGPQANADSVKAVFNRPMCEAKKGDVENPTGDAFDGGFGARIKPSIVFGIEGMGSGRCDMKYHGKPVTREKLARIIADTLEKQIKEKGPLLHEGEEVAFEKFFLIAAEQVGPDSILAKLGIYSTET